MNSKLAGAVALLLTAFIWGTSFVSQVAGMESMSPFAFNAVRFSFGAISLLPVVLLRHRHLRNSGARKTILVSVGCGTVLFAASTLQQYGVLYDMQAGRAGFVTGLYIILVPLLGILLGKKPRALTLVAAIISLTGLYLLCFTGLGGGFGIGDAFLLAGALGFAVHILVVEKAAAAIDPLHLSIGQIATCAAISWLCTLTPGSGVSLHAVSTGILPLLYSGVLSTGIAYTLQIFGQNRMDAAPASIIMSLESFFSVVGGAIILHEALGMQGYIGCALMLAGTILAQIPSRATDTSATA